MEPVDEKLTATVQEALVFLSGANGYLEKYPKERSRLTFAIHKQVGRYAKKMQEAQAEHNLEINAIRARHASTDKDGNIIENKFDVKQGKGEDNSVLRMTYKTEEKIKMDKEVEALNKKFMESTIEIKPPYASGEKFLPIPDGFDFAFVEVFKKFIFDPDLTEEDELKAFLAKAEEPIKPKPSVQSVLN